MRGIGFVLGVAWILAACGGGETRRRDAGTGTGGTEARQGRLLILGFDGVDPRWLDRWSEEGKLPNTTKLIKAHGGRAYRRLGSTNPPQSPVAWTSFATGTRPGEHGIFDFIARDLRDGSGGPPWMPQVATTSFDVPAEGPPEARNRRSGLPFWKLLADDGVRIEAINVPYSFPPDPMRQGRMLSGLGTPDLRGTNSTFFYAGTDVTAERARRPPGGGVLIPLRVQDGAGRFELPGPQIPGRAGEWVRTPVDVRVDGGALALRVSGTDVRAAVGQPTDFVEITWEHEGRRTKGLARFLALEAGAQVRLFVTPISIHPREQYTPITYPRAYGAQLADALDGYFKTVGWDHDTSALNAEVIDDTRWLADMDQIERDRRAMLDHALSREDWELLIWVSTSTDRVAHMFYRLIDPEHPRYDAALAARHGNAIEREYRRMDETIGRVVARLRPEDTLLIISDHGFHNYRRGLHVNQWLRQNGFLTLRDGAETGDLLAAADWSQTQAYALGTGQIYLNRRGREPTGIVSDSDAAGVMQRIRDGLMALRDTERGNAPVVTQVYLASDVFQGARSADAPDLQIAFAENYRTSWETILGGCPAGLFADNTMKWSGDHAASDVRETPGILISNRPLVAETEIVDLAPTALRFFGKTPPPHFAGRPVLAE